MDLQSDRFGDGLRLNLSNWQKSLVFLLRVSLGWIFFYAGATKIFNSSWSAAGYLRAAKTFAGFYQWLASSGNIGWVNFINEWGLTLLGASLIFGVGVRLASIFGAALMILYYLPVLNFPYPNPNSFLVDEHIIYAVILILFAAIRAGRIWGLERWCSTLPICSKFPKMRNWLG